MKVAIGSDHAGFEAKKRLMEALKALGHEVSDQGTSDTASCDYPDYAIRVAREVGGRRADKGVLVCGTGIGMAMTANKVAGVRAAVVTDPITAEMSRRHNDANVLCMGARVLDPAKMEEYLKIFLQTPFDGGRHAGRVEKVNRLD